MLVVEKFPGAGTAEVTEDVEDALAEMAPGLPGITVDTDRLPPGDASSRRRSTTLAARGCSSGSCC